MLSSLEINGIAQYCLSHCPGQIFFQQNPERTIMCILVSYDLLIKNQMTGFTPVNKHFHLYFSEKKNKIGIFLLLNVNTQN